MEVPNFEYDLQSFGSNFPVVFFFVGHLSTQWQNGYTYVSLVVCYQTPTILACLATTKIWKMPMVQSNWVSDASERIHDGVTAMQEATFEATRGILHKLEAAILESFLQPGAIGSPKCLQLTAQGSLHQELDSICGEANDERMQSEEHRLLQRGVQKSAPCVIFISFWG